MEQPSEDRHLKDLGDTEGVDTTSAESIQDGPLTAADEVDLLANQVVSGTDPSPETAAGRLGLEDSPADNPTSDDRFGDEPS